MSARLINTSDFNLRSHGIALSSLRSQLGKQFCLQTSAASSPPTGPGHRLRLPRCPRRTGFCAGGFRQGSPPLTRSTLGCREPSQTQLGALGTLPCWLPGGSLAIFEEHPVFWGAASGPFPLRSEGQPAHIHLCIGYLPSYLRSERQRHS